MLVLVLSICLRELNYHALPAWIILDAIVIRIFTIGTSLGCPSETLAASRQIICIHSSVWLKLLTMLEQLANDVLIHGCS